MGHQFTRATVAAALTFAALTACAGGTDHAASQPAVLDNPRGQVAAATPTNAPVPEASTGVSEIEQVAELPPPDRSDYEGANRVVNLWIGPDGVTEPIDVWGRRTFSTGPILLVSELGFGEASEYFGAPPGYQLSVVGAGAGPDGEELAGLFNAGRNDRVTMIYTNDDLDGDAWAPNLWEATSEQADLAPEPPPYGMGLVFLYAANTRAFDESLTASLGGSSFFVGQGTGECAHQRIEDQGFQAGVLGGTQDVQLVMAPGPAVITLHPWFSADRCEQPAVAEFTVDVPADGVAMVLVYSSDGESISVLQLPVG